MPQPPETKPPGQQQSSEPNQEKCSNCGAPIYNQGLQGLCPRCLLRPFHESLQNDQADELENLQIGPYEIVEELTGGAMGRVFKARQKPFQRIVALKVISGGLLASKETRARFRVEAEIAANLHHPNIVPIYEAGEWEGELFFSMEFIDGPRLDEAHRSKPFSPVVVAGLLVKIAGAVHFAHQRGILHRDIKPANILLD